jgi:heterogeneous nuclear ribonucleoprotein F/H
MNPHMALIYQLSSLNLAAAGARPQGPMPPMMQPGAMMQPGPLPLPGHVQPIPRMVTPDSKTVKIRGLPFRATPLDILSFFDGFQFIAESLQIGVDTLGRPSGEAWLSFASAEEAMRAVRERNRHYLGSRYLELSVS